MSIRKANKQELQQWEDQLKKEGLANPDEPWRGAEKLFEHLQDEKPAEPIGAAGGLLWRRRSYLESTRRAYGRVIQKQRFMCPVCEKNFNARKGSVFCSTKCRMRQHRASQRYANFSSNSEGKAQ